jgi:superfamily II DNA or RNA helicase
MQQLALEEVAAGGQVRIYLHRQMLREQLSRVFTDAGIDHGIQSAGHEVDESKPIQICMTDSVYSRAIVRSHWDLGNPTLVMFDESHQQTGSKARAIINGGVNANGFSWKGHIDNGAFVLGMSATPVNCGELYESLIDFGSYSEMRSVKAHLPVRVYSPSEVDCSGLKQNAENEFAGKDLADRAYRIFGDAYAWWRKLNKDALPSLLFAPSVESSKWFAEEWAKMGVPVAHIDGATCLLPRRGIGGSLYLEQFDSSEEIRNEILRMSKTGEIALVCNRFVLREAIDMPWIKHGIAATVFGGIATYLQSVGRIQRYHPDYDYKVWQCHGGSYWRHGSPNMDRTWNLGDTSKSIAKARMSQVQRSSEPQDVEGICCPKCMVWRQRGVKCPGCGHTHKQSVRAVQMISGELKLMRGVVTKLKKKSKSKTAQEIWNSVLWGSGKVDRSISSAVALWRARCAKDGIFSDTHSLKNPPPERDSVDWHKSVRSIYPWLNK